MSPAAAQIGLLFGPHRVHRHSISPQKIVGRCCNPVNHRGLHRSENGREAIADVGSAAPKTFRSRRTAGWSSDFRSPPDPSPAGDPLARIGQSAGAKPRCRNCRCGILGRSFFEGGALFLYRRMLPMIELTLTDLTLTDL